MSTPTKNGAIDAGIFFFLYLIIAIQPDKAQAMDERDLKVAAARNMRAAAIWLVEHGPERFSQGGQPELSRMLIDRWGVQLWVRPRVEDGRYLALFRIKARGIDYDIINIHRVVISGVLFELWVFKISAADWSGERSRSDFVLARTTGIFDAREIEETTGEFRKEFLNRNGDAIRIPVDDPRILYDLQPWHFPDSYHASGLDDSMVIIDEAGQYRMIRSPH